MSEHIVKAEPGFLSLATISQLFFIAVAAIVGYYFAIRQYKKTNKLGILTKAKAELTSDINRILYKEATNMIEGNIIVAKNAIDTIKCFMGKSELSTIYEKWAIYYKNENNRQACQPGENKIKKESTEALQTIIKIIDKHLL